MADQDSYMASIIEKTINHGREDHSTEYKKLSPNENEYKNFKQCCHVMIYAKSKATVFRNIKTNAIVLMQMRRDGYIGFPGGFVEKGETLVQALCREVEEEMGWKEEKGAISAENKMFSHVNKKNELVFHFFAKEVPENKILEIERNLINAQDLGTEIMGHFRVPMYILGDAFRGFPSFLRNHFIGNSKHQLIQAAIQLNFFTEEQVIQALNSAPNITV